MTALKVHSRITTLFQKQREIMYYLAIKLQSLKWCGFVVEVRVVAAACDVAI